MPPRHAFTLVELLVVIGIIALLIALLLPVLGKAREAANQAKCLATLRGMVQAAHMQASDHGGYMPIAGAQGPRHLGVEPTSIGLLDPSRRKYAYYEDESVSAEVWRPVALPTALGHYMGLQDVFMKLGPQPALATDTVRRAFACPSQDPDRIRASPTIGNGTELIGPIVYMSYILNGAALSRQISSWGETPAGQLSKVKEPSRVFLFADGNSGGSWYGYSVHPRLATDYSLAEQWLGGWHASALFDRDRHRGRINVVFVDGHGETLLLPDAHRSQEDPNNRGELDRAGVLRGTVLR